VLPATSDDGNSCFLTGVENSLDDGDAVRIDRDTWGWVVGMEGTEVVPLLTAFEAGDLINCSSGFESVAVGVKEAEDGMASETAPSVAVMSSGSEAVVGAVDSRVGVARAGITSD